MEKRSKSSSDYLSLSLAGDEAGIVPPARNHATKVLQRVSNIKTSGPVSGGVTKACSCRHSASRAEGGLIDERAPRLPISSVGTLILLGHVPRTPVSSSNSCIHSNANVHTDSFVFFSRQHQRANSPVCVNFTAVIQRRQKNLYSDAYSLTMQHDISISPGKNDIIATAVHRCDPLSP